MASMTFEQVARAAEKLTPEEQVALIARLNARHAILNSQPEPVTREMLIRELEELRAAGAFKNNKSLRGIFAHPSLDLSFEEIQAITHEAATEWEKEWEDLDNGD